jgi:hypothetical protein
MASLDDTLELDYDERNDVLYASLGPPQAALSYEIMEDVLLRYVPPNPAVVGITIIDFLAHYRVEDRAQLLTAAKAVVQDLLQRYPSVPSDERTQELQIVSAENRYVQVFISAAHGTGPDRSTIYVGVAPLVQSPRIHSSQVPAGAQAT